MKSINLLENETVISESQNGICTLTNFRILYSDVQFGKAYYSSILLRNISSIEISYRSHILFIIIGIGIGLLSFLNEEMLFGGLAVGAFFILLYFFSRRHFIVISSKGGVKMKLLVKGMNTREIIKFQNQIEQAILKTDSYGI